MTEKKKWNKREEYIAQVLKMKRVAMSGAGLFDKEDLVGHGILAQLKSTEGESIRIQKQDVQKLYRSAQEQDAMFLLDFVHGPLLVCVSLDQLVSLTRALVQAGVVTITQQDEEQQEESEDFGLDTFL
jgi:hypothetical protein